MSTTQNRQWFRVLARMRAEGETAIYNKTAGFLQDLADDAAAQFADDVTDAFQIISESMGHELAQELRDDVLGLLGESYEVTDDVWQLGLGETPDFAAQLDRFDDRMDGVARTIRDDVNRTLNKYAAGDIDKSDATQTLKDQVEADWRARRTARTESSVITNAGQEQAAQDAGILTMEVTDGDECGWTFHDDPDLADGSMRTLADARSWPIAHPNCLRAFALPDEPVNIPPLNPLGEARARSRAMSRRAIRNRPVLGERYVRTVPSQGLVSNPALVRSRDPLARDPDTSGFSQVGGALLPETTITHTGNGTDGATLYVPASEIEVAHVLPETAAALATTPALRLPGDDKPMGLVPIDDEVRYFDAFFAFLGVVDEYLWLVPPSAFTLGAGANFITNHQWSQLPLGAGQVVHVDDAAGLVGPFRESAMKDDEVRKFLTAYNVQVKAKIKPEVSMGFFVVEWREWDDMTDEERDTGAEVVVDQADLVEVSFVFRGAVPGTSLALRSASGTVEQKAESSPVDPAALAAMRQRSLNAKRALARSRSGA